MPTFPSSPGFRSVNTRVRHYNLTSESINGRLQVRSLGSNRREFTLRFPPMTRAEFDPIHDFINARGGSYETFDIAVPDPDQATFETVTCRFDGDVQEFSVGVDGLYEFEVDLIEEIT
jgi:hypothetical protein